MEGVGVGGWRVSGEVFAEEIRNEWRGMRLRGCKWGGGQDLRGEKREGKARGRGKEGQIWVWAERGGWGWDGN